MNDQSPFSLRPWLAVYCVVALWLTFSNLLTLHSADSLIYSLGSLDHWTLFFWEQDRVGMLIPLMTMPIVNPLGNLLAQTFLMTFAGLVLPLLLVRLLRPSTAGAVAAALCNAWYLLAAPDLLHENQFIVCMYPAALCLGVAALIGAEQRRSLFHLAWALLLMTLGMWTYIAIVVVILPLAVLRWWLAKPRFAGVIITLIAFAIAFVLMKFAHNLPPYDVPTSNATLPWWEWPASGRMFVHRIAERSGGVGWLIGIVVIGLAGLLKWRRPELLIPFGILTTLAIIEIVFCGSRLWVANNRHHPRYIIFSVTAIPLVAAWLFTSAFERSPPRLSDRSWLLVSLFVLLIVASWRHGTPITTRPRTILDQQFGQYSEAILKSGCPAMGAKYWDLWTTYFHLRMVQHDRGGPVPFPIGWRSWEYRRYWHDASVNGPFRVAVPKGVGPELMLESTRRGLEPLVKVGETPELDIFETRLWKR